VRIANEEDGLVNWNDTRSIIKHSTGTVDRIDIGSDGTSGSGSLCFVPLQEAIRKGEQSKHNCETWQGEAGV